MVTFRKMTPEDYDGVDALMGELHRLHVEARPDMYVPVDHPYSREEYMRRVSGDGWISLLAENCGSIIGIAFVELRDRVNMVNSRTAYMHDIYVIPTERRAKIGTMLYRMAEREARERGAHRLDLTVWSFNKDALAFYRAMGFSDQRFILEKDIREEHFSRDCEK